MSTDKNFLSICDNSIVGLQNLGALVPPAGTSDTLKFSNAQNGVVTCEAIIGGAEDCVDFNRGCENLVVECPAFTPSGKFVATVKGGAKNITLRGRIVGHGTEVDIDLGNWSDQSNARTRNVFLDLTTADGSAIRVRVLNADRPVILNPTQRYELETRWSRWFLPVFSLLKAIKIV